MQAEFHLDVKYGNKQKAIKIFIAERGEMITEPV